MRGRAKTLLAVLTIMAFIVSINPFLYAFDDTGIVDNRGYGSPFEGKKYANRTPARFYIQDGIGTYYKGWSSVCGFTEDDGTLGLSAVPVDDIQAFPTLRDEFFGLVYWPPGVGGGINYYKLSTDDTSGNWGKGIQYWNWQPNIHRVIPKITRTEDQVNRSNETGDTFGQYIKKVISGPYREFPYAAGHQRDESSQG